MLYRKKEKKITRKNNTSNTQWFWFMIIEQVFADEFNVAIEAIEIWNS